MEPLFPASLAFVAVILVGLMASAQTSNLMPMPASVTLQQGRLLAARAEVKIEGYKDARLQSAVNRFAKHLETRGGNRAGIALTIHCDGPGQAIQGIEEDESYSLEVTSKTAVLRAHTVVGVMRGLETLQQLGSAGEGGYGFQTATINDKPRFPWRGLLIDVARHWEPVEVIKRNLDGMAAAKLNVFHWHLTEDQGFRVESKKYPDLQGKGSDGQYYTQDQIKDVVAYARDRGIRVIPEFDMPGHVTAWLVGHPELAAAAGPYEIIRTFGVFNGTFDPTKEETYQFLDGFIGEMAELFPDAYMHIGGDENNGKQWSANPAIVAFRKEHGLADNHALQAYFNRRLLEILTRHHKKMVGWDEIFHPDLPKDIVVQSWRGTESLGEGAKKGYTGILSAGYYLDHIDPAWKHYENDPIPANSNLTPEESARILGGEACMWGEHVTPDTIDSRIWPRVAAVAERLWSPREVTDRADMYRRLDVFSQSLDEIGVMHLKERDLMLKRIAGPNNPAALRTLVDTLKPVGFGPRSRVKITQQTPLTGLVDATPPDSHESRAAIALIDGGLANKAELLALFKSWRSASLKLSMMRGTDIPELKILASELGEMGRIGTLAIRRLEGGKEPVLWQTRTKTLLDEASKPHGLVEFTVVPAMRRLVDQAAKK